MCNSKEYIENCRPYWLCNNLERIQHMTEIHTDTDTLEDNIGYCERPYSSLKFAFIHLFSITKIIGFEKNKLICSGRSKINGVSLVHNYAGR